VHIFVYFIAGDFWIFIANMTLLNHLLYVPNYTRQLLHVISLIKKVLPYSLPSVGPGADPGVQAVSPQVTLSHPPIGRLPSLSARPVVTFPDEEHHRPSASTKLCCLVTDAHACKQLAQGCYLVLAESWTCDLLDRKWTLYGLGRDGCLCRQWW